MTETPRADERRFVADVMLGKLARWLRALGYDTLYYSDAPIPGSSASPCARRARC